jgi:protein OPY2
MHADAASTRTRGSLANSILSRASNIIQIAYIPGVTNRNGSASGHNSLLGGNGPVPPVPIATRGSNQPPKSPLSNEGDMLFFRPGDLRDSSYSATSSIRSGLGGQRDTQYTRASITPSLARSSMASEVYRGSTAEMPMPATTVARAAPRMVSIKSAGSGSPGETPGESTPTSGIGFQDFAASTGKSGNGFQIMMPGEGSAAGASPSSSLRGKAKQVTVGSGSSAGKGRFPVRQPSDASTLTATSGKSRHAPAVSSPLAEIDSSDGEDLEDEHARARQSLVDTSTTSPAPLVQPIESPFFDASERPPSASAGKAGGGGPNPYASMAKSVSAGLEKRGGKGNGGLSDIIEEATKRASRVPSHEGLGGRRDVSPFDDVNAAP